VVPARTAPNGTPDRYLRPIPASRDAPYVASRGDIALITSMQRDLSMRNQLRSQTFRIVMLLSALASSSLVLMAGRRWG
jgi:hypothetical protein